MYANKRKYNLPYYKVGCIFLNQNQDGQDSQDNSKVALGFYPAHPFILSILIQTIIA